MVNMRMIFAVVVVVISLFLITTLANANTDGVIGIGTDTYKTTCTARVSNPFFDDRHQINELDCFQRKVAFCTGTFPAGALLIPDKPILILEVNGKANSKAFTLSEKTIVGGGNAQVSISTCYQEKANGGQISIKSEKTGEIVTTQRFTL